jgi:tRNA A-37 threonylcarbamoyl transferase component Bud32/uncharacterized RDD family membrane protein YckC
MGRSSAEAVYVTKTAEKSVEDALAISSTVRATAGGATLDASSQPRARVGRVDDDVIPVRVGDRLDHFTLERELGRGAMGVVYLAHDDSLDRAVAIKVIVSKKNDATALERFFREARAQAKLTSSHVVHIHFIGRAGEGAYFAMEYVPGEALEALLERKGRLDAERGRQLMLEVAHGLRDAHAAGFIHRDIKPSNLLVDKNGHVKVADFGLAKPLSDAGSLTGDGVVLGTPMYMPPEQITGGKVDHRADMYALGASFWNLLAGAPPYDGDSAVAIFAKHLQDPVPSLRAAAPGVPAALAAIVERLMSKEPDKRFASYDELISALEAAAPRPLEPAGFAIRAAASVIDLGIGAVIVGFLGPFAAAGYLAALVGWQAYNGQTLGKYLVRISAERLEGGRLGPVRAAVRVAVAAWLPLMVATVVVLTQGRESLFAIIGKAAEVDQMKGLVTAFAVGNVALSILYAACLGLAAIHPEKRAVHDLLVGSRVVHVRVAVPEAAPKS